MSNLAEKLEEEIYDEELPEESENGVSSQSNIVNINQNKNYKQYSKNNNSGNFKNHKNNISNSFNVNKNKNLENNNDLRRKESIKELPKTRTEGQSTARKIFNSSIGALAGQKKIDDKKASDKITQKAIEELKKKVMLQIIAVAGPALAWIAGSILMIVAAVVVVSIVIPGFDIDNGGTTDPGTGEETPINIIDTTGGDFSKWKQGDDAWSKIKLGSTSLTIGKAGCLSTAVATQIKRSGVTTAVESFNPGSFVTYINSRGGYDLDGSFYWTSPSTSGFAPNFKYYEHIKVMKADKIGIASSIASSINDGCYVVLRVKYGSAQHWVAIYAVTGSDIYMYDPGSSSTGNIVFNTDKYSQYLDGRNWIYACYKVG